MVFRKNMSCNSYNLYYICGMENEYEFNGVVYRKRPELYEAIGVSACGLVVNFRRGLLSQGDNNGYLYVSVKRTGGKRTYKSVHRLVAEYWIPNPENKPWVNHINGIKTDNSVVNLEWTTISENIQHAYRTGLKVAKRGPDSYSWGKKATESTRLKMRDAKIGENHPKFTGWYLTPMGVFDSSSAAAEANGTYINSVSRNCKSGKKYWGFRAKPGNEPAWYKAVVAVKDIRGALILKGMVTRGAVGVYWLTPKGLFGDLETAVMYNGTTVEEVKRLCLLGVKGWSVHKK